MTFFDRNGKPVAYLNENHVFLFDGRPVAYIYEDAVYDFEGYQHGWFVEGWIRDMEGRVVCYTKEAYGNGPVKPTPRVEPCKCVRRIVPVKKARRVKRVRVVFKYEWSPYSGENFF